MIYQALYRAFRPQTFADVVGQDHIVRTLENMLKQQRIYHAFLFCGPRGTGKTTMAKILAKALNCMEAGKPTPSPCLRCASCVGIKEGNNLDVLEIDGASNRGIDEIRDLRESVKYAPNQGRFKVYIVDEVHMLTMEAFNALLKTLEEPPQHVVFIFATTEVQKLPATILSRVQRFDFRRLSHGIIVDRLGEVASDSNIDIEEAALSLIAQAANGGLRDALAMLDQTRSYAGTEAISVGVVQEVVGLVPYAEYARLWEALVAGNIKAALAGLREILSRGKETPQVVEGFIRFCRDLVLYKSAPDLAQPESRSLLGTLSGRSGHALSLVEELLSVERDQRFASDPAILLELAFFRFYQRTRHEQGTPAAAGNVDTEELTRPDVATPTMQSEPTAATVLRPKDRQAISKNPPPATAETPEAEHEPVTEHEAVVKPSKGLTLRMVGQKWPDLLAKIMSETPALGAKLAGAQVLLCQGNKVVLQFEKEFAKNFVAQPDNLAIICKELSRLLEQTVEIECILLEETDQDLLSDQADTEKVETDALKVALSLFEGQDVDPIS